jgi:ArsR family metal-binding transcriptional regulator
MERRFVITVSEAEALVARGDELVSSVRITRVMDCLADPTRIRVVAGLSCDVHEALPYLAALLPQAGYNHTAGILTLVREGRLITVYPQVVTLAKALDEADAEEVLEWLRGKINEAHARRGELEPCLERRRAPRLLEVYRLLPGGNCRRCGEATCLAFAVRLVFAEARTEDCPRLAEPPFAGNGARLAEWLG